MSDSQTPAEKTPNAAWFQNSGFFKLFLMKIFCENRCVRFPFRATSSKRLCYFWKIIPALQHMDWEFGSEELLFWIICFVMRRWFFNIFLIFTSVSIFGPLCAPGLWNLFPSAPRSPASGKIYTEEPFAYQTAVMQVSHHLSLIYREM